MFDTLYHARQPTVVGGHGTMSTEEIIATEVAEWLASPRRTEMLDSVAYYRGENAGIRDRVMRRYLRDVPVEDADAPNHKLAHAAMKNLVDDKVYYLLGRPYALESDADGMTDAVDALLGTDFGYILTRLGYEASNKGVGWLYVYVGENGAPSYTVIPSEQCIPLWADDEHTRLDAMIRLYDQIVYIGRQREVRRKIEWYTPEGVTYYEYDAARVYPDPDREVMVQAYYSRENAAAGFDAVPFIPFKNNVDELPDLHFVRSLVDAYDETRSDNANMLDSMRKLYLVLKGYAGTDMSTFRTQFDRYGVVSIPDASDGSGVDPIQNTADLGGFDRHFEQLKSDIVEYGQGVNKRMDDLGTAPSGVALRFLYSGLDLKCNAIEAEFQRGFRQLVRLLRAAWPLSEGDVRIVFNRDVSINESESIDQCGKSKGIISDRTIIAQHPWVENVDEELERIAEESGEHDDWRGDASTPPPAEPAAQPKKEDEA